MTTFVKHYPKGLLGSCVKSFWFQPASARDTGILALPASRAELVISLAGAPQYNWTDLHRGGERHVSSHATVRVPTGAAVASALPAGGAAFGVTFAPHGLRYFSHIALNEMASGVASIEDVLGPDADQLVERLAEPSTPATKFSIMASWLLARLREPHRAHRQVERAVQLLADPFGQHSVDAVATEVGLSPRRLLDLFRQDVGLAPKMFARVTRFGAALQLVRTVDSARWAEVAATCNYFDQAHMTREFRALAGMSPTAYLERRTTGHANCLPWQPPRLSTLVPGYAETFAAPLPDRGQVGQQVFERLRVG